MADLSDATFLGKLLVLPANVRLDWKVIGTNTLAYFASPSASKKKSFITSTPGVNIRKLFFCVTDGDKK